MENPTDEMSDGERRLLIVVSCFISLLSVIISIASVAITLSILASTANAQVL